MIKWSSNVRARRQLPTYGKHFEDLLHVALRPKSLTEHPDAGMVEVVVGGDPAQGLGLQAVVVLWVERCKYIRGVSTYTVEVHSVGKYIHIEKYLGYYTNTNKEYTIR